MATPSRDRGRGGPAYAGSSPNSGIDGTEPNPARLIGITISPSGGGDDGGAEVGAVEGDDVEPDVQALATSAAAVAIAARTVSRLMSFPFP
jgi:hypothetical protein